MEIIKKIVKNIEKALELLTMFFLVAMVLIIGYQIFNRYVMGVTPKWSEALSLLFMIWFSFIGMAIGVNRGIHLSIEYFVDKLSIKNKRIIYIVNDILIAIFGVIILKNGWELSMLASNTMMPALGVSRLYMYIVMPLSGIMIILYSILNIFKPKSFDRKDEFEIFDNVGG